MFGRSPIWAADKRRTLADALGEERVDALYSSPALRCRRLVGWRIEGSGIGCASRITVWALNCGRPTCGG